MVKEEKRPLSGNDEKRPLSGKDEKRPASGKDEKRPASGNAASTSEEGMHTHAHNARTRLHALVGPLLPGLCEHSVHLPQCCV